MNRYHVSMLLPALLAALGAGLALRAPALAQTLAAEKPRLALVIGNGGYRQQRPLANAVSDARLVADTLKGLGFDAETIIDADLATLRAAVAEFQRALGVSDGTGLLYYAGHAVQADGRNYLLPVDAGKELARIPAESLALEQVLQAMAEGRSERLNIVLLDACRENLFGSDGLANVRQRLPKGAPFLLAYATAPDDVAEDGMGANGPYATALAAAMRSPWLSIDGVFRQVYDEVTQATQRRQFPWHMRSFPGGFYFNRGSEEQFWERISGSRTPADFKAFLEQFPTGNYARTACVMAIAYDQGTGWAPGSASIAHCPPGIPGKAKGERFPDSTRVILEDRALQPLSCDELWEARNEIFKRHGYCFRTPRAARHFGTQGCLTPFEDILVKDPELAMAMGNVHLMRSFASRKRCPGQ